MAGNAPSVEEQFDAANRRAHPDLGPDQMVRGAVVSVLEHDVMVDVDLGLLPDRRLEAPFR